MCHTVGGGRWGGAHHKHSSRLVWVIAAAGASAHKPFAERLPCAQKRRLRLRHAAWVRLLQRSRTPVVFSTRTTTVLAVRGDAVDLGDVPNHSTAGRACEVVIGVPESLFQLPVVLLPGVGVAQHRVRLVEQDADVVPCARRTPQCPQLPSA